jgi:hypothetical protein
MSDALPQWVRNGVRGTRVGVAVDLTPKPTATVSPLLKPGGTGAVITQSDVERYIGLLDPLILSLDNDIYANLVYDDPATLRGKADLITSSTLAPVRDGLLAEATKMESRASGRTAARVAREIAFSQGWREFYSRWPKDKDCGVTDGCTFQSDRWNKIEADDVQFQGFYNDYAAMGYKPTRSLPTPPSSGFSWTIVIWIAGLGVAGYVLSQLWHFLPARTALPVKS